MNDVLNNNSLSSQERFVFSLYQEKKLHKDQRHKHVLHKLLLTGSFFGLGQFTDKSNVFQLFLYIVPLIALVHDLYIFAEHYKVQRIGKFLREKRDLLKNIISDEELLWEEWLEDNNRKNRDQLAYFASLLYTIIISVWTAYIIFYITKLQNASSNPFFIPWIIIWVVGIILVFILGAGYRLIRR